jgi:hypothetical protein
MRFFRWFGLAVCIAGVPIAAHAQETPTEEEAPATEEEAVPMPTSSRMEFDERLIRGEAAAGSVYLFQRRPRQLPGLVPMRRSYRSRIVEPVLGEQPTEGEQ